MSPETENAVANLARVHEEIEYARSLMGEPGARPPGAFNLAEFCQATGMKRSVAQNKIQDLLAEGKLQSARAYVTNALGALVPTTVYWRTQCSNQGSGGTTTKKQSRKF